MSRGRSERLRRASISIPRSTSPHFEPDDDAVAGSWHPGPGTIGASYVLRVLYLSLRARDRINPSDSSTVPLRRLRVAGVEVFHPYRYPHSEIIGARWDE